MSRYLGSSCKLCRREREKLFLKGERCQTKCTLERKRGKNIPGSKGMSRTKTSEYARRLREKQKARRVYGLSEEQFHHYFEKAAKIKKGLTGDSLLRLLETRLDNVVYRMGIFPSRKLARQMVNHGLILVNGKKVDLPGYHLKNSDKITLKEKIKQNVLVKRSLERSVNIPSWISFDKSSFEGTVLAQPSPAEYSHPINSQLIVELYSK